MLLRSVVFGTLRYSGLPWLIREVWQRRKVTIVAYHALPPERAVDHFHALRRRYNIIPLADFLVARSTATMNRLPSKALIITFDDGHKSNFALRSLLESDGIPITIFLCSGIVGTNRHFWWLHANNTREAQLLKTLGDEQRLLALRHHGHTDTREYDTRQALSADEIESLRGFVDFQSHTVFHPILPTCSLDRARAEIIESKTFLEEKYGLAVCAMAYPNGSYSDRERELLRESDYGCALTMRAGFNDAGTDMYCLRRLALPDDGGVSEVIVKASGLWAFLKTALSLLRERLLGDVERPRGAVPPA